MTEKSRLAIAAPAMRANMMTRRTVLVLSLPPKAARLCRGLVLVATVMAAQASPGGVDGGRGLSDKREEAAASG